MRRTHTVSLVTAGAVAALGRLEAGPVPGVLLRRLRLLELPGPPGDAGRPGLGLRRLGRLVEARSGDGAGCRSCWLAAALVAGDRRAGPEAGGRRGATSRSGSGRATGSRSAAGCRRRRCRAIRCLLPRAAGRRAPGPDPGPVRAGGDASAGVPGRDSGRISGSGPGISCWSTSADRRGPLPFAGRFSENPSQPFDGPPRRLRVPARPGRTSATMSKRKSKSRPQARSGAGRRGRAAPSPSRPTRTGRTCPPGCRSSRCAATSSSRRRSCRWWSTGRPACG